MIPRKHTSEHTLHWKKTFARSIVDHETLSTAIPQPHIDKDKLTEIAQSFAIQIPHHVIEQFSDSNPIKNPVLRQYLPSLEELNNTQGYTSNPVGDIEATQTPGVIKKYANRVLLITSNTCPIHCRYCFRRNFIYPKANPNTHRFQNALEYCSRDTTIKEVILSGGDPLTLEDELIDYLFTALAKIPHIKTVRIHTKYPSIIPERVTPALLSTLKNSKLNKVCVFHINHPDEITKAFCDKVRKIKNTETITLNQSVLLYGVNNDSKVLAELSQKLFDAGVLPYYLHMLDQAKGTSHFHVSECDAEKIMEQLKTQLPGYLVPKLAREIAGYTSKFY